MEKEQMISEIIKMKKEKNVVILGHYYQRPEVQDISDFTGDSLKLAQEAEKTDADIILFAGVHFMAETAKILSPNKKVLLPVKEAGCPMADMITAEKLKKYKDENPDVFVICYVNSNADVKALSDICVTSSNAEKIIKHFADKKILYVPDQNLGKYMSEKYGIKIEAWPGYCCVHDFLRPDMVLNMKEKHPNAKFIAHPEARMDVLKLADYVGSTAGLLEYTKNDSAQEYIIGTEEGILYQMEKANPDKKFHILTSNLKCYDMKLTTLEDIYKALKYEQFEVDVPEDIRMKAKKALDKMLELS